MPAKKAAKKSAKKAAKKAAGNHDDSHKAKDLRRAYEHMGRVEILRQSLTHAPADAIAELAKLAKGAIELGQHNDAADLLRASEHLSFASLAGGAFSGDAISEELRQSIADHFDELLRRAHERWEEKEPHPKLLTALYETARKDASKAFRNGSHYQALEFARAAEALAHVRMEGLPRIGRGKKDLRLEAIYLRVCDFRGPALISDLRFAATSHGVCARRVTSLE